MTASIPTPPMPTTPIQLVGIGLEGAAGLSPMVKALIARAEVLVGGKRHLSYFPDFGGERWPLSDLQTMLQRLQQWLQQPDPGSVVVLASGDPLFFGLGRLILESLPPEMVTIHPHLSSVQLAFSRIKRPWQTATLVSVHGRSNDDLVQALRRGDELIAALTDPDHAPPVLRQLIRDLDLPYLYQIWICENLGGPDECITVVQSDQSDPIDHQRFASLAVVIFERIPAPVPALDSLPILGLPDVAFLSFEDRPGLITKQPVRLQILGELALQPHQTVWDIGAGTGSVSVEIGRLCPTAKIFAIEKTAAGIGLIQQNLQRFGLTNVTAVAGAAPAALNGLPRPDRIFIGGSGGQLLEVLQLVGDYLLPGGRLVLALATLEHLSLVLQWLESQPPAIRAKLAPGENREDKTPAPNWQASFLQVQISRSAPIGPLTRWLPLNPVTIITLEKQ